MSSNISTAISSPTASSSNGSASLLSSFSSSSASLKDMLLALYESDKYKDVTFMVADTEVRANEVVVKHRSPVLKAIIEQSNREEDDVIVLEENDLETFKRFLKYLYVGDCEISKCSYVPLYLMAKKYDVECLCYKCLDYFETFIIHKENAQAVINQMMKNPMCPEFFQRAIELYPAAMRSMRFYYVDSYGNFASLFDDYVVLEILKAERPDEDEEDLFAKVVEWAKLKCKQEELEEDSAYLKEALEGFKPYIRFENLKAKTLAAEVRAMGLLDVEELLNYLCKIVLNA